MFMKEQIIPTGANRVLFVMAPMLTMILALIAWAVIPVTDGWAIADINVGVLYLFAISRWACTASSSPGGPPTRNTPSSARCARPRRW